MGNLISYLNPKRTPDCGIYSSLAKPRCNTVSSLLFEVVKKSFWFSRGSVLGQMSGSACFFPGENTYFSCSVKVHARVFIRFFQSAPWPSDLRHDFGVPAGLLGSWSTTGRREISC